MDKLNPILILYMSRFVYYKNILTNPLFLVFSPAKERFPKIT
jgi:hypothetical protein